MKFAVAFALLVAAVLGASASRHGHTDVDQELETLDILIDLGRVEYSGLIDKIRDGLQAVLDRIKERLGGDSALEAIRSKINDVQNRIRDLVKQGGVKLVHAIHDIRDKLEQLLGSIIDRFKPQSYYVSEESSLGARLRQFLQNQLETLKERLAEAKDIAQSVKDKITAEIAEIQGKIQELASQTGQKAIEIYRVIRDKINEAVKAVKDAIFGSKDVSYYAGAEPESFLERLTQRIQDVLEKSLEKIKEKVAQKAELFDLFKEKIEGLQAQIAQLKQKTLAKLLEVVHAIRQKVKDIAEKIAARLSTRDLADEETETHETLVSILVKRAREIAQKALDKIREHIENNKEIFDSFKSTLVSLQEKIKEIGKQTGLKALEAVRALRQKIQDLAARIAERLSIKKESVYSLAADDDNEHETIASLLAKRLQSLAQRALDGLKSLLEKSKGHFEDFKERIEELQAALVEIGKQTGAKALETARAIRKKIQELAGKIADKLSEKNQGYYALYEGEDEERPSGLIETLVQHLVDWVKDSLKSLQERLSKHKDILEEFKTKIADVRERLTELAKKTGVKALEAARALKEKIQELTKTILDRIAGRAGYYLAEEEEEQGLLERLLARVKKGINDGIELFAERIAKHKELAEEFKDKVAEVEKKLVELGKQTGKKALETARAIRNKIIDLNIALLRRIAGQGVGYYVAEEKEEQGLLERILASLKKEINKGIESFAERIAKHKELAEEFKDKVAEVEQRLVELSKQTGRKAIETARAIRFKIIDLNLSLLERIAGKDKQTYSSDEDDEEDKEIDEESGTLISRLIKRAKELVEAGLEQIKKRIERNHELLGEFKDKVDEINRALLEFGKETGRNALTKIRDLNRKVVELNKAILRKITGKTGLYYSDVEKELVDEEEETKEDGDDDDDEEGPMHDFFTKLAKRITGFVKLGLDSLKSEVKQSEEVYEEFKDRIQEVEESLEALAQKTGKKALDGINQVKDQIEELKKDIKEKLEQKVQSYALYDLRGSLLRIRDIVTTTSGVQALKDYLNRLQSSHPVVGLVKDFVAQTSDEELLVILKEFFSGLYYYPAGTSTYVSELPELFQSIREEIQSTSGLEKLRLYAKNLESSHPVVLRIKAVLEIVDDDSIRSFLGELFKGLD